MQCSELFLLRHFFFERRQWKNWNVYVKLIEIITACVLKTHSPQTRILFTTLIIYHVTKPRGKGLRQFFNTFLVFSFFRVTIPFSFQHGDQSVPAKKGRKFVKIIESRNERCDLTEKNSTCKTAVSASNASWAPSSSLVRYSPLCLFFCLKMPTPMITRMRKMMARTVPRIGLVAL